MIECDYQIGVAAVPGELGYPVVEDLSQLDSQGDETEWGFVTEPVMNAPQAMT